MRKLPDYKVGETVLYNDGNEIVKVVISSIGTNRLGIRMFGFEGYGDIRVGENWIAKNTKRPKFLSMTELFDAEDSKEICKRAFNTTSHLFNANPDLPKFNDDDNPLNAWFRGADIRPFMHTHDFAMWFKNYLNGRGLIEVGCGIAAFSKLLSKYGVKVLGIDPRIDISIALKFRMETRGETDLPIHILPKRVEDCKTIFKGVGKKGVVLIANPRKVSFLDATLEQMDKDTELILVTPGDVLDSYYLPNVKIEDITPDLEMGIGEEDERVYRITK